MFNGKNWIVILLSSHLLEIMTPDSDVVQKIPLPSTIVDHNELLNRDGLESIILDWAKLRTYTSTEIIWLLAPSVYFDTIIPATSEISPSKLRADFIDSVPFENVISHDYQIGQTQKVVATNQDLISSLTQIFAKSGYATHAVVPSELLGEFTTLTTVIRGQVISKISEYSSKSLMLRESAITVPHTGTNAAKPKSSLPVLLGVFVVLLLILVVVIYLNQYNIS